MQTTVRERGDLRAVEAVGSREELRRLRATAARRGTLVDAEGPLPDPDRPGRWVLRLVEMTPAQLSRRSALPPPPVLSDGQRRALAIAAVVGAAFGALGLVGWLVVRTVSGAAAWASGHPGPVWLAGIATAVAGLWWLFRRFGGGKECAGVACHCAGCRGGR